MKNQKQYDIFISYSRKDFDEVNAFVEMLKLRIPTLDIWFDLDGIESGDEFRDKIISAIKRSKYVLFALSSNSDKSEWTRKELGFAKGKGIKIVPVLLKGAQLKNMDWFLFEFSGVDCIDIVDTKQIDKLIMNLAKWTQKELATLPSKEPKKNTIQSKKQIYQQTKVPSADSYKIPPKPKLKQWLWIFAVTLLMCGIGVFSWNRHVTQQKVKTEPIQNTTNTIKYDYVKEKGEQFLAENALKVNVITTESGLQYEVIKMGKGKKPSATDKVKVYYHGTLIDGTVFDSSVERGEPVVFGITQIIKGFAEGVQLMPVGSKFRFYIPQELGYGSHKAGIIPPYSTLIFEVELLGIEK